MKKSKEMSRQVKWSRMLSVSLLTIVVSMISSTCEARTFEFRYLGVRGPKEKTGEFSTQKKQGYFLKTAMKQFECKDDAKTEKGKKGIEL